MGSEEATSDNDNPTNAGTATQTKKATPEKRFPWLTVWTALLALATVGLGAAALWNNFLIKEQLPVIQGQLAEMQADKRPWVDILVTPNGQFTIDYSANNANLPVKVALRNFGKSPALSVMYYGEILLRPPENPDVAIQRQKLFVTNCPAAPSLRVMVRPKRSLQALYFFRSDLFPALVISSICLEMT
jgi:hypothetical protein